MKKRSNALFVFGTRDKFSKLKSKEKAKIGTSEPFVRVKRSAVFVCGFSQKPATLSHRFPCFTLFRFAHKKHFCFAKNASLVLLCFATLTRNIFASQKTLRLFSQKHRLRRAVLLFYFVVLRSQENE